MKKLALPEAIGPIHQPYPFGKFAEQVIDEIKLVDFKVVEEEYVITKDGNRMFGLLQVQPDIVEVPDNWSLLVGLRASHDCILSRALTLGSKVMVCSNLCFHGDFGVFKTRQTVNMMDRLPGMINDAINYLPNEAERLVVDFEKFEATELHQDAGDCALVDMFRQGAFSPSQLGRAIKEWDNPSHEEHAEHCFTAWRLFNAATMALKPTGSQGDFLTLQRRSHVIDKMMGNLVH